MSCLCDGAFYLGFNLIRPLWQNWVPWSCHVAGRIYCRKPLWPGRAARRSRIALKGNPKAWLTAQIAPAQQPRTPDGAPFPNGAQLVADLIAYRKQRQSIKQARDDPQGLKAFIKQQRQVLVDEMSARFDLGFTSDQPFAERLVWFWGNHFTISTQNAGTASLAGRS